MQFCTEETAEQNKFERNDDKGGENEIEMVISISIKFCTLSNSLVFQSLSWCFSRLLPAISIVP